jgi:hypothetical protein
VDGASNPKATREVNKLGGWLGVAGNDLDALPETENSETNFVHNCNSETNFVINSEPGNIQNPKSETNFVLNFKQVDIRDAYETVLMVQEPPEVAFVSAVSSDYNEPKNFDEAWNHPDPVKQAKWRKSINDELKSLEKRKVWRVIKKSDVPANRRLMGCKWVFKIKRDGRFKSRMVAQGFSQIPGVDFTESFAPVVNDITFRIVITLMLVCNFEGICIDVETAFLYGDLDEEIYMKCPEGLKHAVDECVRLLQSIYGIVQAARAFWKRLVTALKKVGFVQCQADGCLLFRKSKEGICIVCLYVDDCLAVGSKAALDRLVEDMKKVFDIKVDGTFNDYLGCELVLSDDRKRAWLGQPHLMKRLETKFIDMVGNMQSYKTPGTPGYIVSRPAEGDTLVDDETQKIFRSGVGMLLYAVKHSRPDLGNPTRELAKVMDGATEAHFKELKRVIKHAIDTNDKGLRMFPNREEKDVWKLDGLCDSDFAGDKETRCSVCGYAMYFMGVPIAWKSKLMKSVTLSTTEAEYVSISEIVKEVLFVVAVLMSMEIEVQKPVVIKCDNNGAIFLTNNCTTSNRTKHVDVRRHFVREYTQSGAIKVVFVRSEDNDSDMMTKNVAGNLYEKHAAKVLCTRDDVE